MSHKTNISKNEMNILIPTCNARRKRCINWKKIKILGKQLFVFFKTLNKISSSFCILSKLNNQLTADWVLKTTLNLNNFWSQSPCKEWNAWIPEKLLDQMPHRGDGPCCCSLHYPPLPPPTPNPSPAGLTLLGAFVRPKILVKNWKEIYIF